MFEVQWVLVMGTLSLRSNSLYIFLVKCIIICPNDSSNLFLFLTVFLWVPTVWCHINGRVQYHEQGFKGIESYRYGFEVPDLYNPQSRHEERDENGVVIGRYSYLEPSGKIKEIHYTAHPAQGFKITKTLSIEPPTTLPPPLPPPPPPPPFPPSIEPVFDPKKIPYDSDSDSDSDSDFDYNLPFANHFGYREPKKPMVILTSSEEGQNGDEEIDSGVSETIPNLTNEAQLLEIALSRSPIYNRVKIPKPLTKTGHRKKVKKSKNKEKKKKKKRRTKKKKVKATWIKSSTLRTKTRPSSSKRKKSMRYVMLKLTPQSSKLQSSKLKRKPKRKKSRRQSKTRTKKVLNIRALNSDPFVDDTLSDLVIRKLIESDD